MRLIACFTIVDAKPVISWQQKMIDWYIKVKALAVI